MTGISSSRGADYSVYGGSMRASKSIFIMRLTLAGAGAGVLVTQGAQGGGRGGQQANVVTIKEGEECPAGMTEFRHLRCQAPATPPPSIVDYRPRSTVVAQPHLAPKAKFPVVDVHTHGTSNAAGFAQRIPEMDALNLRVLVDLSGGSDPA